MKNKIKIVTILTIILLISACNNDDDATVAPLEESKNWLLDTGLLWENHIEPKSSGVYDTPGSGKRIWYVDASASNNGNGSESSPFNTMDFLEDTNTQGDHIYLTGTFTPTHSNHANGVIMVLSSEHGGTNEEPTVIKSWPEKPRAVLDGQNTKRPIEVRGNSVLDFSGKIVFQNLDIKNGPNAGVLISEFVEAVEFVSCSVHDNPVSDTSSSSIGGLVLVIGETAEQTFIVRNCVFYNNNIRLTDQLPITGSAADNIGDLITLSNQHDKSHRRKFSFYLNKFTNGYHAINQKGSGVVEGDIYNNYFDNYNNALKQRCVRYGSDNGQQKFHHNLIDRLSGFAVSLDPRNQLAGDNQLDLYNNTILSCSRLLGQHGVDNRNSDHLRFVNIYNNIVMGIILDNDFIIDNFEPALDDLYTENNNLYSKPSTDMIWFNSDGIVYNWEQMQAGIPDILVSNNSSRADINDVMFIDEENGDYRLSNGSPAQGTGVNGTNIGAF